METKPKANSLVADPGPSVLLEDVLMDNYTTLVLTAQRVTACRSTAEDVVQDVYVKLRNRPCSSRPGCEAAYVRRMVRNHAFAILRRRSTGERLAREIAVGTPIGPEEDVMAGLQSRELRDGLQALSPRQAEVVTLRYVAGLSVEETAGRLALSTGSVKQHAHRGLRRLRTMMVPGSTERTWVPASMAQAA